MSCCSKDYWKIHHVLCTNTHHEVTDLVKQQMVKNTKTWIPWEWNIIFLSNKKILDLCLRWHILRNYCFVAGVTFRHFYISSLENGEYFCGMVELTTPSLYQNSLINNIVNKIKNSNWFKKKNKRMLTLTSIK